MRPANPARRLTVFCREDERFGHHPLYHEIVHRAHAAGMAGATVVRGIEGYGRHNRVHTTRILSLSEELPLVVVIVDGVEAIDRFLPTLREIAPDKLVLIDDVLIAP